LLYSTAAEIGDLRDDTGSENDFTGHIESIDQSKVSELVRQLSAFTDEELADVISKTSTKLSNRKLGGLASAANLKPGIMEEAKIIILPSTFKEPDNSIGHLMLQLSRKLGYEIRLLPVSQTSLEEPSEFYQKTGLGMFMSLDDSKYMFRFTKKIDPYENGRTIARSQQVIGALNHLHASGQEVLKPNNFFFGNVQSKAATIKSDLEAQETRAPKKRKKESVQTSPHWVKTAPALFWEKDHRQNLVKVLVSLLRKSWVLVDPDILWDNTVPYIVSYAEMVRSYCTRSIVTVPARGRTPAVTKDKVPQKPRSNNLLLKAEISLIDRISAPLWESTPWERITSDEWAQCVLANGIGKIKTDLTSLYSARATFLSKIAALTTKRLQELRKLSETLKYKRKGDITQDLLENMLLARADPVDAFVSEIVGLDPTGDLFLKEWATGTVTQRLKGDKSAPLMNEIKRSIRLEILQDGFYTDILSRREESLAQLVRHKERMQLEAQERSAWISTLKEQYGSETIDKWSANLKDFNFKDSLWGALDPELRKMVPKSKGKTKIPPHEPLKPSPSRKVKKKDKKENLLMIRPNYPEMVSIEEFVSEEMIPVITNLLKTYHSQKSDLWRFVYANLILWRKGEEMHLSLRLPLTGKNPPGSAEELLQLIDSLTEGPEFDGFSMIFNY
jgi:hypothetical protein